MSDEEDIERESGPNASAPAVRVSRRRRSLVPRFGLRSLLIAGILFSVAFAWIGRGLYRVRQEDAAIEAIERAGGTIAFESAPNSTESLAPSEEEKTPTRDGLGGQLRRAVGWTKRLVGIDSWETDARRLDAALAALPTLPEIRELALHGPAFDDSIVETLGSLPRLESIHVSFTSITGEGLSKLRAPERIRELTLTGETNPDVLSGIPALTGLRDVMVGYRSLNGENVAAIASLPNVERLDLLAGMPIGENVYAPLANAKTLEVLEIVAGDADGFDEGDLQALSELPRLRELVLDGLTEANLAAFEAPPSLRVLTISNGLHPEAARRLDALEDISPQALQRFSAEHPRCEVRCIQDDYTRRRYFFLDGEPIDPPPEWEK